jgi:hypothetical protein
MTVDRYTKVVLTVIAVCLVWIALGGPSVITPVSAQVGDRVILAGWVDERGSFKAFPAPTTNEYRDRSGRLIPQNPPAFVAAPLPMWQSNP